MRADLVIAILLFGCDSSELPIVTETDMGTAPVDLARPVDLMMSSPPDLLLVPGVACGAYHCASDVDQFCDTADDGITGVCRAHVAPTNLGFGCDGPEDCATATCCHTANGSACSALGFCTLNNMTGDWMCHTDPECGSGFVCCDLASGSPYRICKHAC